MMPYYLRINSDTWRNFIHTISLFITTVPIPIIKMLVGCFCHVCGCQLKQSEMDVMKEQLEKKESEIEELNERRPIPKVYNFRVYEFLNEEKILTKWNNESMTFDRKS